MKIVAFTIPKTQPSLFHLQEDIVPYFYNQLHQHPEIQLTLILAGEGNLITGDYTGRFAPGDLFLIGSNQIHALLSDHVYYQNKGLQAHALTLFFKNTDEHLWSLPELSAANNFFSHVINGLRIEGKTAQKIASLLQSFHQQDKLEQVINFLSIINTLIQSEDFKALSVITHQQATVTTDEKRMQTILNYTFKESHREIFLEEVAKLANLSKEAFCRYFKVHTRKTYFTFLNEVRISNACKLLLQQELDIQDICYRVGFTNLSYFNRTFKKITGKTPSQFSSATLSA